MIVARRRLPLTTPLQVGEPATSFAERLARRNGVSITRFFCSDLGIDWIKLMAGEAEVVTDLAHLGGVDAATLLLSTPRIEQEKNYRLGAELLKSSSLVRKRLRFCPACIQEDLQREAGIYQRSEWQVEAVRTCSAHHCLLVEAPCETKYGSVWEFGDQVRRLPVPLHETITKVEAAAPLRLQSYVRARIDGAVGTGWLDRLDLHVVVQTSERLGLLLTQGAEADPKTVMPQAWISAGEAGFHELARGEDAFWDSLRRILKPIPFEQQKPRTVFNNFHMWLTFRRDDKSFDPIRQSYTRFVFAHFALPDGVTIFGVENPHKTLFNIPCAAKLMGVTKREMATKALQAGLATHNRETAHIKLLKPITLAQAKQFTTELHSLIDTQDAARRLGLNKRVFEQLVRRGFIKSSRKTPHGPWKFKPSDLDAFVQLWLRHELLRSSMPNTSRSASLRISKAGHPDRWPCSYEPQRFCRIKMCMAQGIFIFEVRCLNLGKSPRTQKESRPLGRFFCALRHTISPSISIYLAENPIYLTTNPLKCSVAKIYTMKSMTERRENPQTMWRATQLLFFNILLIYNDFIFVFATISCYDS